MNLLKILNLSAILSMVFNTYLWTLSFIHVCSEHPSQDVITILLAFLLMNGWVWLVLIVNVAKLKEAEKLHWYPTGDEHIGA